MKIAGLDEVGRGALAGPLIAAAVSLNPKQQIPNLKDSKKLNQKQRERVDKLIYESGALVMIETISVNLINKRGIGWANKEIFKRLIKKTDADKYIIDGNLKFKNKKIKSVVKADNTRKCVMAAAIVAKVYRDEQMKMLHERYKVYGWDKNKGYGTSTHIKALKTYGISKHHRSLFVRTALTK